MKKLLFILAAIFIVSTSFYKSYSTAPTVSKLDKDTAAASTSASENYTGQTATGVYSTLKFTKNILNEKVFEKAYAGFQKLKKAGKISENCHLLTVCDFTLSSTKERLWVIDTNNGEILYNTLVAHGKNTGEEFAQHFSNTDSSLQSSMGFYVTDVTYNGGNGYSLRLLGMDKGYNDRAEQRAVVMHGADYVSEEFAKTQHRIGRSWGCPAVPRALAEPIINTIKGKNVLFIYYSDEQYLKSSEWLQT